MNEQEAKEIQEILVSEGMCSDMDDAAHFLVDSGEIDSTTHAELLSEKERKRVYGE
jgi:acyl carrier protein